MLSIVVTLATLTAGPPWPETLYVCSEPHRLRVPITITAPEGQALNGTPVAVPVGDPPTGVPIVGQPLSALRVCDESGQELLWALTARDGSAETTGLIEDGGILYVPAVCPAGGSATVYVYADSPGAWPVPDMLPIGFANSGFEDGAIESPAAWVAAETDATHRVSIVPGAGRDGMRAARCDVDAGAPSTWVKYVQTRIPVVPGATYRVSGWVRAQGCTGTVGLFIHVNGDKPQLINRVENAGDGTYDWRHIAFEVTAPPNSTDATIGTVLYGTGTAWYDDFSFEAAEQAPRVTVGERERLELTSMGADWLRVGSWIEVYNTSDEPRQGVAVLADMRPAIIGWKREHGDYSSTVSATVTGHDAAQVREGLLFAADLAPLSATTFEAELTRSDGDGNGPRALVRSPANLTKGAAFETDEDLAAWEWRAQPEGPNEGVEVAAGKGGPVGDGCMRLTVAKEVAPNWVGARQSGIPVRPGATYYYGAYVRTGELGGTINIHAHTHDTQGKVLQFISAGPGIGANTDWTWLSTVFTVAPGAVDVQLHLTMNTWGTAYYDGVVLMEVVRAKVWRTAGGLPTVALVDPLVKVFREDHYQQSAQAVHVYVARNEYEPFQLAINPSSVKIEQASVSVDEPVGPGGATLDPIVIHRVGYVRVDYPTAYYRSTAPAYARKLPAGGAASDGWAGWWPDPMIPVTGGVTGLQHADTVPLWFTAHVPKGAPPGDYVGRVRITMGTQTFDLPLTVTVWDFELPDDTHLRAIYDLGQGPSQVQVFDPQHRDKAMESWYRLYASHRLCPNMVPPPTFRLEGGKVVMDTSEFDRWAALCFDELRFNSFYTPWDFYACGWAYRPHDFLGFAAFTPEYVAALKDAYGQYVRYITDHGWRDRAIHYVSDEPFMDQPQVVKDLQDFCATCGEVAPDIPRYSSTWRPCPALEGAVTLWGAGHYGCFPVDKMKERQAAGDQILFTTDGQMCIDTPWCAVERLLPSYAFKYGSLGYEFWGMSWWTYDPWDYGWHTFISQSDQGTDYYWVRYPNGDGYLAYPGERYGVTGPLPSIRMEQAREGQEDAEYLYLLRDLAERLRAAGKDASYADEALQASANLVPIPNPGGLRSSEVLPDPTAVARVRIKLAEAIVKAKGALGVAS